MSLPTRRRRAAGKRDGDRRAAGARRPPDGAPAVALLRERRRPLLQVSGERHRRGIGKEVAAALEPIARDAPADGRDECVPSALSVGLLQHADLGRDVAVGEGAHIGGGGKVDVAEQPDTAAPNTRIEISASLKVELRRVSARSTDAEPDAANGVNERIVLLIVDLAPHPPDIDVDDVGGRIEMQVPDVLQEHRARHHLALVADEILEHLELARQQLDAAALAGAPRARRDRS